MRLSAWFGLALLCSGWLAATMGQDPGGDADGKQEVECFIVAQRGKAASIREIELELCVRNVSCADVAYTYLHNEREQFFVEVRDLSGNLLRAWSAASLISPQGADLLPQEARIPPQGTVTQHCRLDASDELPDGLYSVVCRFDCDTFEVRSPEARIRIGQDPELIIETDDLFDES